VVDIDLILSNSASLVHPAIRGTSNQNQ